MLRLSIVCLSLALTFFTMTLANPCPCELFVSDSTTSTIPSNDLTDNKFLEDYLDLLGSTTESSSEIATLYPTLLRQTKSLELARPRNKRPSWAAVGKRAASFAHKRPSWAQVG